MAALSKVLRHELSMRLRIASQILKKSVRSSSSNPPMLPALDLDQFAHVLPPPNRGDTFHHTTASAVILHSFSLIPTGTRITGRLIDAKAAGHFSGAAELSLELVSLRLPNGSPG